MAMNSVLQYMQGLLNGLTIPGQSKPLATVLVPGVQMPLTGPIALIIPGPVHGERKSAPRGQGLIEIPWWIDIYLKYETNPNAELLDQLFPLIVDAILYACWKPGLPLYLTDPTTGRITNLVALGEAFEVDPQPPETPATMRSLLFSALIRIEAKEYLQA